MLTLLRAWWWPAYALVYPLAWPIGFSPTRANQYLSHLLVLLVFIVGGLLLELLAHPGLRLTDLRHLGRTLRAHPAVAVATLYGAWALIAAAFAPDPAIAFAGNPTELSDGAYWAALLALSFCLIYIRAANDPSQFRRAAWALVLAGGILALVGAVEVWLGHGLLYNVGGADVPQSFFPQKGHLSGMLVISIGAAIGLMPRLPLVILGIAAVVGATVNRAALLGLIAIAVRSIWLPRRALAWAVVALVGFGAGWGLVQLRQGEAAKNITNAGSSVSRSYIWRAAVRGIAARPVFGWGGTFYDHWYQYLSKQETAEYLKAEYGLTILGQKDNVFQIKRSDGTIDSFWFSFWKAHNQFLDEGLLRGVPGVLLFLSLWVLAFRRTAPQVAPFQLALVGYATFLLVWFAAPEGEGVLWACLGLGCAGVTPSVAARPLNVIPKTEKTAPLF